MLKISQHAVDRYCERIRKVPVERARDEMVQCFHAAEKHHRRLAKKKGSTVMIQTGCCLLVFGGGKRNRTIVTVLPRVVHSIPMPNPNVRGVT